MARATIHINGRPYHVACDDGQEAHLARLGVYMDKRAKELISAVGQVNESLLLVMTSLLVCDELSEAYSELEKLRAVVDDSGEAKHEAEKEAVESINKITERIEALAEKFEQG